MAKTRSSSSDEEDHVVGRDSGVRHRQLQREAIDDDMEVRQQDREKERKDAHDVAAPSATLPLSLAMRRRFAATPGSGHYRSASVAVGDVDRRSIVYEIPRILHSRDGAVGLSPLHIAVDAEHPHSADLRLLRPVEEIQPNTAPLSHLGPNYADARVARRITLTEDEMELIRRNRELQIPERRHRRVSLTVTGSDEEAKAFVVSALQQPQHHSSAEQASADQQVTHHHRSHSTASGSSVRSRRDQAAEQPLDHSSSHHSPSPSVTPERVGGGSPSTPAHHMRHPTGVHEQEQGATHNSYADKWHRMLRGISLFTQYQLSKYTTVVINGLANIVVNKFFSQEGKNSYFFDRIAGKTPSEMLGLTLQTWLMVSFAVFAFRTIINAKNNPTNIKQESGIGSDIKYALGFADERAHFPKTNISVLTPADAPVRAVKWAAKIISSENKIAAQAKIAER